MKNIKEENSYKLIYFKTKVLKLVYISYKTVQVVSALIINIMLVWFFVNAKDLITRIVIIPFLICALTALAQIIANLIHKDKYAKIFSKIYTLSFMLYWFGFLIFMCYLAIRDKQFSMLLFSIPFWIIGISVFYKRIVKR